MSNLIVWEKLGKCFKMLSAETLPSIIIIKKKIAKILHDTVRINVFLMGYKTAINH